MLLLKAVKNPLCKFSLGNLHSKLVCSYSSLVTSSSSLLNKTVVEESHVLNGEIKVSTSDDTHSDHAEIEQKKPKKRKRNSKIIVPKTSYNTLREKMTHFTSYCVTVEQISAVSITNNLEITHCGEMPFGFKDIRFHDGIVKQVHKINEFTNKFPASAEYCIMETNFPWRQNLILLHKHIQYVQGMIISQYNHNTPDYRSYQIMRNAIGKHFNLLIEDRRTSGCKLLHKILRHGSWNGQEIVLPENIVVADDAILIKTINKQDENSLEEKWSKMSEPLHEAMLQGIGFIDIINSQKPEIINE